MFGKPRIPIVGGGIGGMILGRVLTKVLRNSLQKRQVQYQGQPGSRRGLRFR
jgi:hypothetical protein